MKLTREGIKEREAWEKAGINLPGYDVEAVTEKAKKEPGWVHFGIGNIFRVFIGGIADGLLEEGVLDRGITCVETFDYDVVDKIYAPYDNLGLNVILHGDGTREYKVLGALAEAVKAQSSDAGQWNRLKEIFAAKSLQLVSFTITEKGYALQKADGTWFPFVEADIKNGPDKATGAMAVLVAMLNERYKAGKYPIALVSMDNCSQNGAKLRESVLTMTEEWHKAGFVDDGFVDYVTDEKVVAFPWTMIDKITPRPSEQIAADLEKLGVEDMQPVITGKKTYIAGLHLFFLLILITALFIFTVWLQDTEKKIPVTYSGKLQGKSTFKGVSTNTIPIKLCPGGVVPIIFASSLISFPILIAQIAGAKQNAVLKLLNSGYWFNTSKPWYTFGALIYLVLIFAFSYFYTEITMNPEEIANNIKKSGGNIAGIRAGSSTAEYLRKQMKYLIAIGSFCLCIIAIIPFIVSGLTGLSRLSFFGTSIIITVSVILETKKLILSKTQENYYMNRVKKGGLFRG